jgi:RNA polymerase sigma-54 factor
MLKPSIQLRFGQSLSMTPQLQQAIKLLQLSSVELQQEIQQLFETNPMLEKDEGNDIQADADNNDVENDSNDGLVEDQEIPEQQEQISDELVVDSSWEDVYQEPNIYSESPQEAKTDIYENQAVHSSSLHEHLQQQLDLLHLSDTDRVIGMTLIDEIDNDGYLVDSVESIFKDLQESLPELECDEVIAVLHLIQHLDPVGSGAQNLAECLLIQLNLLPADTPLLESAQRVVTDYIEALGKRDLVTIQKKLKLNSDELHHIIELIQSLNPRPGAQMADSDTQYVIPDVSVVKYKNTWRIELNTDVAPKLRINSLYSGMIKRADNSSENDYLRSQLQEARWFIKSLQSRNETLLRVSSAIIDEQINFLEQGPEAMKPLVLKDIAEQLELHESTVSRVTTNKYLHTPRGIFELKYFFSSHVSTADGGMCSATAIRAMLKKMIQEENPAKPLSDNKIAKTLDEKGIKVARRTVAKYREAMNIPPSNERKQL